MYYMLPVIFYGSGAAALKTVSIRGQEFFGVVGNEAFFAVIEIDAVLADDAGTAVVFVFVDEGSQGFLLQIAVLLDSRSFFGRSEIRRFYAALLADRRIKGRLVRAFCFDDTGAAAAKWTIFQGFHAGCAPLVIFCWGNEVPFSYYSTLRG